MQNATFLGTDPIGKLLRRLAIPTITAQVINMLYNVVDRIYIGNMPDIGALALTGIGLCTPILMIVSAFAALVGSGGAPRASIAMGTGDEKQAGKILGNCFTLQIVIALVLSVILLCSHRTLLMLFGASENTIEYAVDYLKIYSLGTIFVQLTLGMNAFITAQGFSQVSMKTVIIGAILNIILDPIFIFVLDMGVSGAAIATVISQGVSCLWVLWFLFGKKAIVRLQKKYMGINPKVLGNCIALGLSPFIMQASESILSICFNTSLLRYGGDVAVGAMTIISSVMQLGFLPLQGLAQGAQPITSYNYGAGNAKRVKETFTLLLKWSVGLTVFLWILLMLVPHMFARLFTGDAELITFTIPAMRIYFGAFLVFGVQMSCQMTFVAIGYAKISIIVAIMRKFVLLIPLIYILPMFTEQKTMAVYFAEPVADFLSAVFTAVMFCIQFKQAMKNLELKNS